MAIKWRIDTSDQVFLVISEAKDGVAGYAVISTDGHRSWLPRGQFYRGQFYASPREVRPEEKVTPVE